MSAEQSAFLFTARNRDMTIEGDGISLTFDIIQEESHSWELTPSTHPVEEGSPFTDHVRKELRKGELTGLITNFGLKRGETESNYAQDVFDVFEYYRDNSVPVTVVTTLKIYENYLITRVSVARTGGTGEAQAFRVSFQEFRTVSLKAAEGVAEIKIPADELGEDSVAGEDATQASPNADVGEQTGEDPSATESGKLERFVNFTDFASGAYGP